MTQIFAVRDDGEKFRELDLEILDVTRHAPEDSEFDHIIDFCLHNTAMKPWWKTPNTEFIDTGAKPPLPIPDICRWIDSSLVLSPKACRILGDMLKDSGEFLPVSIGEETYYIFNCLVEGDADEEKSEFNYVGDMQMELKHLEFKPGVSELLVFKTTLESCLTLFCGERFKDAVETYELTGVVFDDELIKVYE